MTNWTTKLLRVFLILSLVLLDRYSFAATAAKKTPVDAKSECIPSDHATFHCFTTGSSKDTDNHDKKLRYCHDSDAECSNWAERGECQRNPNYMLAHCRASCNTCVDGHAGMTQMAPDDALRSQVHHRLIQTAKYVHDETSRNVKSLNTCYNQHALCTHWAVKGRCESHEEYMKEHCAAACHVCHTTTTE